MDNIIIKGLRVFAYHGVNPEEKRDGQNFVLDITASVDISRACETDDLNDTVSYAKILKTAVRAFTAEKYDLLERAAEAVAESIFSEFGKIEGLDITVKKPEAPIKADFDYVAVNIRRKR